jgi:hypothetical protein
MKLYGHFAAAYGTIWLVLLGLSVISQTRINTGAFGLIGFPVIALVYAFIRLGSEPSPDENMRLQQRLLRRVAELEEELQQRPKSGN